MLRIGGADGEGPEELSQVLGVARITDGRVVIANGGSTELRGTVIPQKPTTWAVPWQGRRLGGERDAPRTLLAARCRS